MHNKKVRFSLDKPYKCPNCEYSVVKNVTLKRHIISAHSEKSYQCPLCEFKCSSSAEIKVHQIGCHNKFQKNEKPLNTDSCPYCTFTCVQVGDMMCNHKKYYHWNTISNRK